MKLWSTIDSYYDKKNYMRLSLIPAGKDNYVWILYDKKNAIIVDPGEAYHAITFIKKIGVRLKLILITHNHRDHTDGLEDICRAFKNDLPTVFVSKHNFYQYSPKIVRISGNDNYCFSDFEVNSFSTYGHSLDHISYLVRYISLQKKCISILFTGDALFSCGCGNVNSGYSSMYNSLMKLSMLDRNTIICCGHEYTRSNLRFAAHEKQDKYLDHIELCAEASIIKLPTLPSNLEVEAKNNIFLEEYALENFILCRIRKDNFK